ncbi:hypothetical protein [Caldiplasma sukawensis]
MAVLSGFKFMSLNQIIQNYEKNPLIMLNFLIPVLVILLFFLAVRIRASLAKQDSIPDIDSKMESFETPDKNFEEEMNFVMKKDYDHFEKIEDSAQKKIFFLVKEMRKSIRKYNRINYRLNLAISDKKIQNLKKRKESEMEKIVKIHAKIQTNLDTIDRELISQIRENGE